MNPALHALVGGMIFCLTGPGRAVITAVRPIHPIGTIEVVGYAVRPNPFPRGEAGLSGTGTLRTHGFTADRTVDVPCVGVNGYELGLELTVPPGTNAGANGWEIDYRVGDHTASTTFPLSTVLCSTPSTDDKPCKHVWQQYGLPW
jgi:hypothetical protein